MWELLEGRVLACGHHSAQAWREAESVDHCQDSEVPLVWHRLLVSPGLAGHGVGIFLLTVQFCDSVRPETGPRAQFHKASISALCPPPPPTPVEYFQIRGCVLGSASAVVLFCTRRDACVHSWSELQTSQLETGAEHLWATAGGNPEEEKLQPQQPE